MSEQPFFARTQPDSIKDTSEMFVWGSNSFSEIGLSEDIVTHNKDAYHKMSKKAYLSKPVKNTDFHSMVHQVACGNINSSMIIVNQGETSIIQMGMCAILDEKYEQRHGEKNLM